MFFLSLLLKRPLNKMVCQRGSDIQAVSPSKLREIFGADSVLYLDVTQYGTSYQVIASETRVMPVLNWLIYVMVPYCGVDMPVHRGRRIQHRMVWWAC